MFACRFNTVNVEIHVPPDGTHETPCEDPEMVTNPSVDAVTLNVVEDGLLLFARITDALVVYRTKPFIPGALARVEVVICIYDVEAAPSGTSLSVETFTLK